MSYLPRRTLALIAVCFFLLLPTVQAIARNALYVLGNKAYTAPANQQEQLARVNQVTYKMGMCANQTITDSTAAIIQNFDDCYANHPLPLQIITHTIQLPAHILAEGSSRPGESSGDVVTLFGVGYVQSRLFFLSEETDSWIISVHAKHDAPAPVILEIWLDDQSIGRLVFDKGDDTWETLSLAAPIKPGFHNFYFRYVNDLFDQEQGLDRNAYIEYVQIARRN
ncbi:MAG: hypothetical protein IPM39_04185 [Chloroflexi bacterium]|nr:hypothetical protein [Chloroflexota bacterium]